MSGRTTRGVVLALTLIAGLAATWLVLQPPSGGSSSGLLRPDNPVQVARGAELYALNCAACHGKQLEGGADWQTANPDGTLPAPPHDATGHTWHHADALLFRLTKFGSRKALGMEDMPSNMPAFEGLMSDEDIVAVLSFIKASWPDDIRDRHDEINRQAAQAD